MSLSSLSLSSQATSLLCAYRNQLRSEEFWWSGNLNIDGRQLTIRNICVNHQTRQDFPFIRQTVQPLYFFLIAAAAIETFSYAVFFLLNIGSSSTAAQLKSSIFTLFWNISNLLDNLTEPNINTLECFARYNFTSNKENFRQNICYSTLIASTIAFYFLGVYAIRAMFFKRLPPTTFNWLLAISISLSQASLSILFGLWMRNQMTHLLCMSPRDQEMIYQFVQNNNVHFNISDLGKDAEDLILEHVLKEGSLDARTREKLLEIFDPEAILLASTKITYLYAFGPYKEKPIPTFFSTKTVPLITSLREKHGTTFEYTFGTKKDEIPEAPSILALREKYPTNPFINAPSSFFYSLDNFNADLSPDDPLKSLWTDLKGAGNEAIQGSPLINESLGKAIKIINKNTVA